MENAINTYYGASGNLESNYIDEEDDYNQGIDTGNKQRRMHNPSRGDYDRNDPSGRKGHSSGGFGDFGRSFFSSACSIFVGNHLYFCLKLSLQLCFSLIISIFLVPSFFIGLSSSQSW